MNTKYQRLVIDKIKKYRQENNLSQADVANILGISYGQVGNIESTSKPHKYTLKQISTLCKLFDVSVLDVFMCTDQFDDECDLELINNLVDRIIEYNE